MENNPAVEAPIEAKTQDIYVRHVEGFVKAAEENLDKALDQYGFTVWHSLPAKEAAVLKERLGAGALEATDLYNKGTAAAMDGQWAEAETNLRAALKRDPEYAAAAFNLAVCLEKRGRPDEARKVYETCIQILDRARGRRDRRWGTDAEIAQEAARIHQHLEILGKS